MYPSKWIVIIVVSLVVLFVLYAVGRKEVRTEIFINATPGEVWAVLTDAPGYKDWNPVLVPVEGNYKEGTTLKYKMIQPDGKQSIVESKVVKMRPQVELNQFGGIPLVLTFDHHWVLEPTEGGTNVIQWEQYRGIGVPFWNPSWVEIAYNQANERLRNQVIQLKEMSSN